MLVVHSKPLVEFSVELWGVHKITGGFLSAVGYLLVY